MSRIARQEIYYGKYVSMDDIIKGVEKVTAGQVQRLAQQLFVRDDVSLTILGPLSKTDVPDAVLEI
ncbi:MAG TPA: insulinase family protein, partial [Nitrospirota bacterium]